MRPDIALLPIGGIFAMDWRAGVEAAGLLKASLSIPMHYSCLLGGRSAGRRFARRIGPGAMVMPGSRPARGKRLPSRLKAEERQ